MITVLYWASRMWCCFVVNASTFSNSIVKCQKGGKLQKNYQKDKKHQRGKSLKKTRKVAWSYICLNWSSFLPSVWALSSCLATGQTGLMRARYGCLARLGCNKLDFLRLWDWPVTAAAPERLHNQQFQNLWRPTAEKSTWRLNDWGRMQMMTMMIILFWIFAFTHDRKEIDIRTTHLAIQ